MLVAEDLTDFPVLITDAVVQASLFAHARSDGADIVVTAADETTRLKRELVTYDAIAGELELYVKIPSLSSVTDTEILRLLRQCRCLGGERYRHLERRLRRRLPPEGGPRRHGAPGQGQHRQRGARHL
jgi:hypothetical protein